MTLLVLLVLMSKTAVAADWLQLLEFCSAGLSAVQGEIYEREKLGNSTAGIKLANGIRTKRVMNW